jgi:AcrR family transcriptional regulator
MRIAVSAEQLIAEGGYQAAAMSAVAARAGVGVGSVYRQFPSKAELFADVFRRASARELEMVEAAITGTGGALRCLEAVVETFARRALAGRRLAWALIAEPVDPLVEAERLVFRRAYRDLLADVIAEGIATGELPDQEPELCAGALVGAIGEALVGPLAPLAGELDVDTLIAGLVGFCLRAVSAEEISRVDC